MKNVMEEIEEARRIIKSEYDIMADKITEIVDNSTGQYSAVCNGFLLGYLRGIGAIEDNLRL